MTLLLSACGIFSVDQDGAPDRSLDWHSIPDAEPRVETLSKTGNPTSYVVDGQRYYVDLELREFTQNGRASWYGTKFHGNLTSSGEPYDMYKMTAAHKTLPLPSYVRVRNLENDKQVIVKVNDRGPFVDGRVIDLSYAAAQKLGIVKNGTAKVALEVLATPSSSNSVTNSDETMVAAASSPRKYFVQVGAFSDLVNAENFRDQLASQSIEPAVVRSYAGINGDMHKVQVGPVNSSQDLQKLESRLTELGYTQLFIITE